MTIKEFTLEVTGFPNERIRDYEIETFFQTLSQSQELKNVTNVTLAYKFQNSLENILKVSTNKLKVADQRHKLTLDSVRGYERTKLNISIDKLMKEAKKQNQIAKKKLGLGEKDLIDYRKMEDQTILKAFVSFEDTKSADQMRKLLNDVKKLICVLKFWG